MGGIMPTTINNQATASYQFSGSGEVNTVTTNLNSVVLEDSQGLSITKTGSPNTFLAGDIITYTITITNTSTPIPPIQWVRQRQKFIPFGMEAMSIKIVEPVVVKPDTVSKRAST